MDEKAGRWGLGKPLKNPQGTQALRRSELWQLGGTPQTRAVCWAVTPCSGLPSTEPPAVGVRVWGSSRWMHVDLAGSQRSGRP